MCKITSYSADYQTFPTLFELESVGGKKVTVDFSAPRTLLARRTAPCPRT